MSCTYCPYCSPCKLWLASKQKVQLIKKESKSCIEGAKYSAKKYLPPPSKMCGVTFQCNNSWGPGWGQGWWKCEINNLQLLHAPLHVAVACHRMVFNPHTRGLRFGMPFPGNRIFPGKIWEISCPEHSGRSSSCPVSVPKQQVLVTLVLDPMV